MHFEHADAMPYPCKGHMKFSSLRNILGMGARKAKNRRKNTKKLPNRKEKNHLTLSAPSRVGSGSIYIKSTTGGIMQKTQQIHDRN